MTPSALLVALAIVSACAIDETSTHAPVTGSQALLDLNPVAYWRFGEASGTTARDARSGIEATYHGVTLGRAGALDDDSDTAVGLDESSASYVDLADRRIYSLARAHDDFARSLTFGWGTTPSGDTWVTQAQSPVDYGTDDDRGVMNLSHKSGVFQQGLYPVQLVDGDMQTHVAWTQHATLDYLVAASLVARRTDADNFVRVELREHADHTLSLAIVRTANGDDELLASTPLGASYALGERWYVRFQFTDKLRARAWPKDLTHTRPAGACLDPDTGTFACELSYQPAFWQVEADDPSPRAGTVALRHDNTRSSTDPVVTFAGFWLQTPGITFHMWWRPTSPGLVFTGEPEGPRTVSEVAGKGSGNRSGDDEYYFKFYSNDSDGDCGMFKAYIHNLEGGHGAGARYPRDGDCHTAPDPIEQDVWHQLVVVFDAGDYLDRAAGVNLYVDGALYLGAGEGLGTLYSGLDPLKPGYPLNAQWQIIPRNGDAPFRLGTRSKSSFFTGDIDEFAIFSRALTASEVLALHAVL